MRQKDELHCDTMYLPHLTIAYTFLAYFFPLASLLGLSVTRKKKRDKKD